MLEAEVLETDESYLVGYWVEEGTFYVVNEFLIENLAYLYAARLNSANTVH